MVFVTQVKMHAPACERCCTGHTESKHKHGLLLKT